MQKAKPKINTRKRPTIRKGPARFSKRVDRRIEMAATFCASIKEFKDLANEGFGERFAAELRDGEAMPDHAMSLELARRSVRSSIQALIAAEEAYRRMCARRRRARKECERIARRELHPEMVAVRRMIDAHYGKEAGALIHGLEGKTLRKPRRVVEQAKVMVGALEAELPVAKMGVPADRLEAWRRRVESPYDRLRAELEKLERLERKEEHLRSVRDLALDEFDIAHGDALAYAQAFYRLVGIAPRVTRWLRSAMERRRLIREARQERRARAQGRRPPAARPVIERAVSAAARWLRSVRSRVA